METVTQISSRFEPVECASPVLPESILALWLVSPLDTVRDRSHIKFAPEDAYEAMIHGENRLLEPVQL
jgi:hypothetical protein